MPPRAPRSQHPDCLSVRPSQGPWPSPRALSQVLRLAQNATDSQSPRLSPPLGSRERQVPKPYGTTSASQDLGGHGGWALGRWRRIVKKKHPPIGGEAICGPTAASG